MFQESWGKAVLRLPGGIRKILREGGFSHEIQGTVRVTSK